MSRIIRMNGRFTDRMNASRAENASWSSAASTLRNMWGPPPVKKPVGGLGEDRRGIVDPGVRSPEAPAAWYASAGDVIWSLTFRNAWLSPLVRRSLGLAE